MTVEASDSESDTENFMGRTTEDGTPKIPSEPRGKCSTKLQEKIALELELGKRKHQNFCSKMRENKQFRNPSIYDKLIETTGIIETGTNFSDHVLMKNSWKPESFYKQLAEKQQKDYEKREAERKNDPNSKIKQMVMAEKEKKSKWDEKSQSTKDLKDKQRRAQSIQDKLNKHLMAKNS